LDSTGTGGIFLVILDQTEGEDTWKKIYRVIPKIRFNTKKSQNNPKKYQLNPKKYQNNPKNTPLGLGNPKKSNPNKSD
jgi:hypothetical protein